MRLYNEKLISYLKHKNFITESLRQIIQKHIDLTNLRTKIWVSRDPYANDPLVSSYKSKYPIVLGIIKEFWHSHWHYIAACRDLGVAYKVIDISDPDWQQVVESSGCDAFLIHPSVQFSIWKQMCDERLRIIT